jgi:hypothetical protein
MAPKPHVGFRYSRVKRDHPRDGQSSILTISHTAGRRRVHERNSVTQTDSYTAKRGGRTWARRSPKGMTACRHGTVSVSDSPSDLRFWSPRSDSNRRPSDYESDRCLPTRPSQDHRGCSRTGRIPTGTVAYRLVVVPGLPERLPTRDFATVCLRRLGVTSIRSQSDARSPTSSSVGVWWGGLVWQQAAGPPGRPAIHPRRPRAGCTPHTRPQRQQLRVPPATAVARSTALARHARPRPAKIAHRLGYRSSAGIRCKDSWPPVNGGNVPPRPPQPARRSASAFE